ncbi:hypothetical protein WJX72_006089 [[Myrmecia] bisecta]|uniref:Uncharacterized protein n=1 Tax=[Myrmecia] bisecta TaxID=41462 RepID=A0AAW1QQZ4_9CHLO
MADCWQRCQRSACPGGEGLLDADNQQVKEIASIARSSKRRGPLDNTYVWGLVFKQKKQLVLAGLALLFCTSCNLAAPVITGILFEILVGKQPLSHYPRYLAVLGVMYICEPLMTRVYIRNACAAGEKVLAALRLELFRTLLLQKIEFFDRHSAPELTSLLSVELDSIRSFIFSNVSRDRGPRALLEALGGMTVLFVLSWRLGPVLALVIVATAATAALYRVQTKAVEVSNSKALAAMVGVADQAFSAITTVRSFAGEALERERFGMFVAQSYASGLGFARAKAVLESLNRLAVHASLLLLYGLGGYLISHNLMPIRILLSAIGFTFSLVFATQGVVQSFSDVRRVSSSLRRVRAILGASDPDPTMFGALPPGAWWEHAATNGAHPVDVEPYGPDAGDAAVEAARSGNLELRDVWFAYPLRPSATVLTGLNLTLQRGTVTAVVGRSGAGKSTVAALLSRFYEPSQGGIYLGDQAASQFTRGEWARAIALVSQEPVLFAGSIGDNIGYGRYGRCSQQEIEAAASAANAHEFILALPEGYDTMVGERGMLLSGGQRQRIAIARALLKDSPIIILDEATSALDAKSEKLVQQAIETLVAGRTVLVIAHRLSTVQAADQIVVLEGGQVAEVGTHKELVKKQALYAELVSSQSLSLFASV